MVAQSSGAPERRLTDAPVGVSQREVDGETWRDFTVEDPGRGVRVIGQRLDAARETPSLAEVDVGALVTETVEGLRLAVRTLHENAVQHMEAGTVAWRARPGGGGIGVRDEGPGIPEDELPHVATRYFRGHKSATGSSHGLAIAEMASRRSGLSLRLRNRPAARG